LQYRLSQSNEGEFQPDQLITKSGGCWGEVVNHRGKLLFYHHPPVHSISFFSGSSNHTATSSIYMLCGI